ncbi:hypothetical protein HanRHA438_Chr06g0273201 [Helianthus annuus]|uniref:Uncharacterized protein n=1 Tax=Helianthus annuus TaxID=4232 RepID=A0A251UJJ6_HELAN|nr:hypothetical protein HanXRQr2_Chr06g0263911 [Helianthus annuus]KAJ0912345.1 hypothetical protein HanRHA438_Chr06g0273201 [Helianthus annuus]KAJ0915847.1 hypothetical protein HanPSC8_Chr06g0254571 [Helianthus annuus]
MLMQVRVCWVHIRTNRVEIWWCLLSFRLMEYCWKWFRTLETRLNLIASFVMLCFVA